MKDWPDIDLDAAFEMYRPLVEDNEQAITVMLRWEGGVGTVIEIEHEGLQESLLALHESFAHPADAVLLSSEVWLRMFKPGGIEHLGEGVIIVYCDRLGDERVRRVEFFRTKDGVVWGDQIDGLEKGGLIPVLRTMVGRA